MLPLPLTLYIFSYAYYFDLLDTSFMLLLFLLFHLPCIYNFMGNLFSAPVQGRIFTSIDS